MVIGDIFPTSEGFNVILINVIFAIVILLFGIFLGRFISYFLNKIIKKIDIKNKTQYNFIGLAIATIRWSIYIGFLSISLNQLAAPLFSNVLTKMLVTIPAFTGALILIGVGFAIAIYLRNIIKESEIEELKTLSQYLYYFVIYIFGVYAINLALISTDDIVRNNIIISLTIIAALALTYSLVKKQNIN